MPATKEDLGPYEALIARARRLAREVNRLEQDLTEALNSAYVQGARDARKAITGIDPQAKGGENNG